MCKDNIKEKSTSEIIIEQLIEKLKVVSEFDEDTLTKLRMLTSKGMITNQSQVENALKINRGENENH